MHEFSILRIAQKSLSDLLGLVRYWEHPASALHLQLHAKALEQFHGLCRWKGPQRRIQKARVRAHMAQKFLCRAVVGHIAAALAGDKDLLAGLVHVFQHRHLMPLTHGGTRRHQSCRACTDDQYFRHPFSLPSPNNTSLSYQNRHTKAMCCRISANYNSWARMLFCTMRPAGVRARVRPSKLA